MNQREYIKVTMIGIMSLVISFPIWASAAEVGNFTEVEKRVDYQKGATGPVTPAKVKGPVEVNDVIQTYEVSRAQVLFRDKTTIIIAPKSKVAVESYMFDPAKFERSGNFDLIQGVMKVVVPAGETLEQMNLIIKTSTATMGVRGTEFVVISGLNFSVVYTIKGRVCLKSNRKEPGKYSVRRAAPGEAIEEDEVCLDPGTMSVILINQPPSSAQPVSPAVMGAAQALVQSGINEVPGACAVTSLPGVDMVAVANDLMSRGANLESVKESLTANCYAADTYSYSPPAAPVVIAGPTTPQGAGGVTGVEAGGVTGVETPPPAGPSPYQ